MLTSVAAPLANGIVLYIYERFDGVLQTFTHSDSYSNVYLEIPSTSPRIAIAMEER